MRTKKLNDSQNTGRDKTTLTLRALTKGNVWDLQESDIFMMWAKPDKDDAVGEHGRHYMDIIRSAFDVEELKTENPDVLKKYEERGMRIGIIPIKDKEQKWAIKKRSISRVTDLSYENIHHISAAKLLGEEYGWYIVGGLPTAEFIQMTGAAQLKNVHFIDHVTKEKLKEYKCQIRHN